MPRRVPLVRLLAERHPDLPSPEQAIAAGTVLVDGAVLTNPRANVDPGCRLVVAPPRAPRGEAKLAAALDRTGMPVAGRVAVDVGACTGGFTSELLRRGAARVYAVDVGHGQLLGRLRQHPAVVNLEGVNAAALSPVLVPDEVGLVTIDVSYTPLAVVVPQLSAGLRLAPGARLLALVKPMFELQLGELPAAARHDEAVARAAAGLGVAGWVVEETFRSAVTGSRGAVEFWASARWGDRRKLRVADDVLRAGGPEQGGERQWRSPC